MPSPSPLPAAPPSHTGTTTAVTPRLSVAVSHDVDDGWPEVRAETLAEVTADVSGAVLALHRDLWPSLARTVHVAHPDPADCASVERCHPLAVASPQARTPEPVGHLHQQRLTDDGDRSEGARPLHAVGAEDAAPTGEAPLAVIGELIAAGVARDLLDFLAAAERHHSEHLAAALISNRRIAVAQGIVMARTRLTSDQALDLLTVASQQHHRTMRDIAEDVVRTGTVPSTG